MSPEVRAVVGALRALLEQTNAPGTAPERTEVLAENGGADIVIEHSGIPGLVLVIAAGGGTAGVYWAQFHNREWKDELDDARDVTQALIPIEPMSQSALDELADAVRRQLATPLEYVETRARGRRLMTEVWLPKSQDREGRRRLLWRCRHGWLGLLPHLGAEKRTLGTVSFIEPDLPGEQPI
jgi:hypothetical protein